MPQVNNFLDFYRSHSKVFRFFGIVPIFTGGGYSSGNSTPKFNRFVFVAIALFLMVYWTGVVFSFLIDRHLNDKISIISNWIQMLGNSVALTTTLGSTILKYSDFGQIILQFHRIDENILAIGHRVDYGSHLRRSKVIVFCYLGLLGGLMAYDFYITIEKYHMTSVWYWLVSVTPLIVYSIGLYHAMFMIYWIKYRCSLLNKVLKQIRFNGATSKLPLSPKIEAPLPVTSVQVQPREKAAGGDGKALQRQKSMGNFDMNILSQLFTIMNDLCKLSRKIDEYYGLFFLTSIGALFAITSIQVYYCYVTSVTFDETRNFSVWTLMVSVNLVTVNLSLIVGITTVCENVSNEATKILQNFSALQIKQDVPILSELCIWVHPMVSYMKFTAYGFFTIDYNMLCGFMTALVTYLIIFIQFYAINGDKDSKNTIRGVANQKNGSPADKPQVQSINSMRQV